MLWAAWVVHDVEEAVMFPRTCDVLADRTGIESLRMTPRQSWAAVGLMGLLISAVAIMWPGARWACRDSVRNGVGMGLLDRVRGGAVLLSAAVLCHVVARRIVRT